MDLKLRPEARRHPGVKTIGLVLIALLAVTACSRDADGSPEVCEPNLLDDAGDVQAASRDMEVWALFFATYSGLAPGEPVFVLKDQEIKIVWRATGDGDAEFRALGPDGASTSPIWGPDAHSGSTWDSHPGDEWGTGWVFPEAGCWSLELRRGESLAYLDVEVRT